MFRSTEGRKEFVEKEGETKKARPSFQKIGLLKLSISQIGIQLIAQVLVNGRTTDDVEDNAFIGFYCSAVIGVNSCCSVAFLQLNIDS